MEEFLTFSNLLQIVKNPSNDHTAFGSVTPDPYSKSGVRFKWSVSRQNFKNYKFGYILTLKLTLPQINHLLKFIYLKVANDVYDVLYLSKLADVPLSSIDIRAHSLILSSPSPEGFSQQDVDRQNKSTKSHVPKGDHTYTQDFE